jgi:ELWxxDGT repeat protein
MLSNIVLFEGDNTFNTTSLWETDGVTGGTFELTDVAAPPPLITEEADYGFVPYVSVSLDLTVFNNQVLFSGRMGSGKLGVYTLWTTDGTAGGTVPLTIAGASSSGLFSATVTPDFTVFGAEVLFRGIDKAGASGLWMTNGTASGTTEITGIGGTAAKGINPTDITVFNGSVLFNGADTAGHLGLWTTDGTGAGTQELTSIAGAASGLDPTDMTVFNGEVLFNGLDANGLSGLWMTNGSAAGTHELIAGAGGASDPAGLDPTDMTSFGSEILFSGLDVNGLTGLWVTDGTAIGTHEILAETAGATAAKDPHGLSPSDLTVFNGKVYFSGFDQFGRKQLWESDGTTTQMLTVAGSAVPFGLNPSNMEVYNGQLLFQGTNLKGFSGLWTTNGTAAGTHEISPSASATYQFGFGPSDLTALTPGSSLPPPPPPPPTVTGSILWQNTSGQASIWEMAGNSLVGGGPVSPTPGPSWTEIGAGDFNKDGHSDILWQNASTGQASIWEMSGATLIGGGPVSPNPGPSWKAIGTGDFSGDGFSDGILWQNTSTGQASIWEMSGSSLVGGGPVTPNPGTAWKAVGTGDFNHDGFSDILWQNANTGQVSIWEMHGNNLIGVGPVAPNPGTAWQAIGTGDFNQDGFSDILFQNKNSGAVSVWEMNGNNLIGGGPVSANPGTSWHAIGTGGGGSDILLQNTSGQTSIWEMNGNTIAGGGPVSPNPGPNWHAIGLT